MIEPLVSVIVPTYNSFDTIERTLSSVFIQTYSNIQLIIVDDCSTDNTLKLVDSILPETLNVKIIRKRTNLGVADSRNIGLNESEGDFVAFLDSDDVWAKEKISKQLKHMQNNQLDFSYTNYDVIKGSENLIKTRLSPDKITYESMLRLNKVGCSTVMIRMEKLRSVNIPIIKKRNDWALWLSMLKIVKTGELLPESLTIYYIRENSLSSGKKTSLIKYHYQVYRRCEGFSKVESVILTLRNLIYIIGDKANKG